MIVGDSESGYIRRFQIFYYICEFLTGRYTAGVMPDTGDVVLDTIPVDYVARVLKYSSARSELAGQVLHLCSGPELAMTVAEIGQRVQAQFEPQRKRRRRKIPLPVFRLLVRVLSVLLPGSRGRALANLQLLLAHLEAAQRFENSATVGFLRQGGLETPQPARYLDHVLDYYLRHRNR